MTQPDATPNPRPVLPLDYAAPDEMTVRTPSIVQFLLGVGACVSLIVHWWLARGGGHGWMVNAGLHVAGLLWISSAVHRIGGWKWFSAGVATGILLVILVPLALLIIICGF